MADIFSFQYILNVSIKLIRKKKKQNKQRNVIKIGEPAGHNALIKAVKIHKNSSNTKDILFYIFRQAINNLAFVVSNKESFTSVMPIFANRF